ncbi:helix-turn-helix domain-containing protein [Bosea sp. NPDC055332]
MPRGRLDLIDREIGKRIRQRRKELRLSQGELADRIEVSYQQFGRYEDGKSRISAGVLVKLLEPLSVPIAYFYEGMVTKIAASGLSDAEQIRYAPQSAEALRSRLSQAAAIISDLDKLEAVTHLTELFARDEAKG